MVSKFLRAHTCWFLSWSCGQIMMVGVRLILYWITFIIISLLLSTIMLYVIGHVEGYITMSITCTNVDASTKAPPSTWFYMFLQIGGYLSLTANRNWFLFTICCTVMDKKKQSFSLLLLFLPMFVALLFRVNHIINYLQLVGYSIVSRENIQIFLVADTQLYKRLCRPVRRGDRFKKKLKN